MSYSSFCLHASPEALASSSDAYSRGFDAWSFSMYFGNIDKQAIGIITNTATYNITREFKCPLLIAYRLYEVIKY